MIRVTYNGSVYDGRLIAIHAVEDKSSLPNGDIVYDNKAYDVTIMDAFGAIIYLLITDLNAIEFV